MIVMLRQIRKDTCAWAVEGAQNCLIAVHEASLQQSWEVHPLGQTQDA